MLGECSFPNGSREPNVSRRRRGLQKQTTVGDRPLDDAELIERATEGDLHAYEGLVGSYQGIAHRTAFLLTGSSADAEDATQEAFVKAFYALPRFRPGAPFRPWLLKIVANEAISRRRAAGCTERLNLRLTEVRPSGDAVPSPEAAALKDEDRRELLAAVGRLGERDRLAITCRFWLELSEAETAEVLGCARGTVKSRLSRALGRLRAAMPAGLVDSPTATGGDPG